MKQQIPFWERENVTEVEQVIEYIFELQGFLPPLEPDLIPTTTDANYVIDYLCENIRNLVKKGAQVSEGMTIPEDASLEEIEQAKLYIKTYEDSINSESIDQKASAMTEVLYGLCELSEMLYVFCKGEEPNEYNDFNFKVEDHMKRKSIDFEVNQKVIDTLHKRYSQEHDGIGIDPARLRFTMFAYTVIKEDPEFKAFFEAYHE